MSFPLLFIELLPSLHSGWAQRCPPLRTFTCFGPSFPPQDHLIIFCCITMVCFLANSSLWKYHVCFLFVYCLLLLTPIMRRRLFSLRFEKEGVGDWIPGYSVPTHFSPFLSLRELPCSCAEFWGVRTNGSNATGGLKGLFLMEPS